MDANDVRGHLDGLLLAVLESGPLHGYGIIEALQRRSGGALQLPTGTVYPALRRLERARWIEGTWSVVDGRKRRTYSLSPAGRKELARRRSEWVRFTGVIGKVLGGGACVRRCWSAWKRPCAGRAAHARTCWPRSATVSRTPRTLTVPPDCLPGPPASVPRPSSVTRSKSPLSCRRN